MNAPWTCRRMLRIAVLVVLISDASSLRENYCMPTRPRRRIFFGSMDMLQRDSLSVSAASASRRTVTDSVVAHVARRKEREKDVMEQSEQDDEGSSRGSNIWPPWPFNLLTQQGSRNSNNGRDEMYKRGSISLFWSYFGQRLLITKRQFQHGKCNSKCHSLSCRFLLLTLLLLFRLFLFSFLLVISCGQWEVSYGFIYLPLEHL